MLVLDVNIILERIRWCVTIVVILDFEKKMEILQKWIMDTKCQMS